MLLPAALSWLETVTKELSILPQYRVFAIGDLHLPGPENKTMEIFGANWENHRAKVRERWTEIIRPTDYVLCPGDLSWAMDLAGAKNDLDFLGTLPGNIIIVKGNHDYWWQSISKVRSALPPNVYAIQNDFVPLGETIAICGTRGWTLPTFPNFSEETDRKVYEREIIRLQLSLESAKRAGRKPYFVMLHYPPLASDVNTPSESTLDPAAGSSHLAIAELLEAYGVRHCVYGHLHGYSIGSARVGEIRGVYYHLVSADALGFTPKLIDEI